MIIRDVITNENVTSVRERMHSKLKELPVAGPRTHVEPANGFLSITDRWHECSGYLKKARGRQCRAAIGDSFDEQYLAGGRRGSRRIIVRWCAYTFNCKVIFVCGIIRDSDVPWPPVVTNGPIGRFPVSQRSVAVCVGVKYLLCWWSYIFLDVCWYRTKSSLI